MNWAFWPKAAAGNFTTVVIKPLEFPVHACRPVRTLSVTPMVPL